MTDLGVPGLNPSQMAGLPIIIFAIILYRKLCFPSQIPKTYL